MAADVLTRQTVDDLIINDDFFDSDVDPFGDEALQKGTRQTSANTRDDKSTLSPRRTLKRKAPGDALDRELDNDDRAYDSTKIDQEIKIKKQRVPIPKLDAERLLSERGIPKIRALTKSGITDFKRKLRLKGKGHEFTDCARLLNFYQMWLDNLYPRAKFADALQLVEKVGHSKHMQVHRKSWIDEGKPGYRRRGSIEKERENVNEMTDAGVEGERQGTQAIHQDASEAMFFPQEHDLPSDGSMDNAPDEDELSALIAQDESANLTGTKLPTESHTLKAPIHMSDDDDDELEAFLAEETSRQKRLNRENEHKQRNTEPARAETHAEHRDGLDDLIGLDAAYTSDTGAGAQGEESRMHSGSDDEPRTERAGQISPTERGDTTVREDGIEEEPELPQPPTRPSQATAQDQSTSRTEDLPSLDAYTVSSSPLPNIHTDDLDQLMDEHEQTKQTPRGKDGGELAQEFLRSSPPPV